MRKTIAIGALNENTRLFYQELLADVLGHSQDIISYNFNQFKQQKVQADLLLISTPMMINLVKPFLKEHTKTIPIGRTFTKKAFNSLKKLTPGTKLLLVNNGVDTTFETISLIYSLGIQLELYPFYPGLEPLKDLKTAITTNEMHLVPDHVTTVHNIGHMVYDMGTIIEILEHLDLEEEEKETILHRYQHRIVPTKAGVGSLFDRNVILRKEMQGILDLITDGVIGTDDQGVIQLVNQKALEVLQKPLRAWYGKNIRDVFSDLPQENGAGFEDRLVQWEKEYLVMNSKPTLVYNHPEGHIYSFKKVTELRKLEERVRSAIALKGHIARYRMEDILGGSDTINQVRQMASRMAQTDSTILISGESGTGKELFAQAIHNQSARCDHPFIAINCAALPDNLVESELFGYEAGAFTGASKEGKPGLFEDAHGGTLFLDEIGDFSLKLQGKLLRVLQEGEVARIGSTQIRKVDVRLISATNKNLQQLARADQFRWDLYYRLSVFPLRIPALRERQEDIEGLFTYFLNCFSCHKNVTDPLVLLLKAHPWEGNVRELRNVAEYLAQMSENPMGIQDLPHHFYEVAQGSAPEQELNEIELKIIYLLYERNQAREKTGRRKLMKLLEDQQIIMTEKDVRHYLVALEEKGMVAIGRGRQGTQLTYRGLQMASGQKTRSSG